MAGITIDISAKVTGYEASLKAMKDAFAKIDPGSEIGKKLEKAIKQAESQLNNLGKNVNPRILSETQLDSTIEKVNRVGESIQEVSNLMQNVNVGDINFGNFENSVNKMMNDLASLRTQLDSNLTQGLQEAITNSTELSDALKKIKVDPTDKSATQIFDAISEKAIKATEDTEAARVALEEASKKLASSENSLQQLENNPIYNKDNLKKELSSITQDYTKIFKDLKASVSKGLKELLPNNKTDANDFAKQFMEGLNPENLASHLKNLKDQVQSILGSKTSAKSIYETLLGTDVTDGASTAPSIAKKIITNLDSILPGIRERLKQKMQELSSSFTSKESGTIDSLINGRDIQAALEATEKAIERAYTKLSGTIIQKRNEVNGLLANKEAAQQNFNNASGAEKDIYNLIANITDQYDKVMQDNAKLYAEVADLRKQIEVQKDTETGQIKDTAKGAGTKTNSFKIGANEAKKYSGELDRVLAKEKLVGKIEGVVQRWFSIYAAVRMVSNAVRSVISTVKELDKTITEIAIVTDKTQNDLWGQMKSYTDMARQYATSISGVYKVSQLYYQQGLQQADVMSLTEQTLKMARISGLDYAKATDYMTNAVRSFKMEMTDSQRVVDVYSEIAASSATNTAELATAMSKTASSAQAVGSSFENTSAMMAVMIEATRESAENIGSAMKSIISRYGEMTKDPSQLIDSEGQEMSLNKVDKALQSVGISIQDANHQFRGFDDVITELAGKWDTIDTNTQRYIATIMAGNRQQSRFLALVSNGERLAELSEKAANSEDSATLQVLKTMDSIEAKSQQLKTSLQSLYTSSGVQNVFKGFLDTGNQIIKTFTQMPTILGAPIPAILKIGTTFASLASVVTTVFGIIKTKLSAQKATINAEEQAAANERIVIAEIEEQQKELIMARKLNMSALINRQINHQEWAASQERIKQYEAELEEKRALALKQNSQNGSASSKMGMSLGLNIAGVALSTISGAISDKTQGSKIAKGLTGIAGSAASMAGMGLMMSNGNPIGAGIGAALGAVMGIVENINFLWESAEARANRLKEAATEANNTYLQKRNDYTSYKEEIDELKKLEEARNDSKEAEQEFIEASNKIATQHPELVTAYDEEGNAILDLAASYHTLEDARQAAIEAGENAAQASINSAIEARKQAEDRLKNQPGESRREFFTKDIDTKAISDKAASLMTQDLGIDISELGQEELENFKNTVSALVNGATDISGALLSLQTVLSNKNILFDEQGLENTKKYLNQIASLNTGSNNVLKYVDSVYANQQDMGWLKAIVNSAQDLGDYENTIDLVNKNREKLNDFAKEANDSAFNDFIVALESYTGSIIQAQGDINKAVEQQSMSERSGIASTVRGFMYGTEADKEKNTDFFKEFDEVNNLISGYVYDAFKTFKENAPNPDKAFSDFTKSGRALNAYNEIYELISAIWSTATDSQKERLNDLLKNNGKYNKDQFGTALQDIFPTMNKELIQQLQDQYYNTAYSFNDYVKALASRYNNQDFQLLGSRQADLLESLGGDELQKVLNVYDTIASQIKSKQISPEIGQNIFDNYLDIWEVTKGMDDNSRELAQNLLSGWDDFSLTGLNEFRQKVQDTEGLSDENKQNLIKAAESFSNLVPKNFDVELQSFSQKVTSNMEDFEKALSNAAKGMDLKTATELAQKIGKSLSDFDFKNGKFFFEDYAEIRDAYLGENERFKEDLKQEAQNIKEQYQKFPTGIKISDSNGNVKEIFRYDKYQEYSQEAINDFTDFVNRNSDAIVKSGFNTTELINYYEKYLKEADTTAQSFVDFVAEDTGKKLDESLNAVDEYTNDQIARTALSIGDFTGFLDQILPSNSRENAEKRAQLQQSLQSGNIDTVLATFPEYASDILKYYQNINKNVYDKLISGLDSQQYINADQFSSATLEKLEANELITRVSGAGKNAIYKTLEKMSEEQLDQFADIVSGDKNIIKADKDKMLASIHTEKYEDNIYEGLSGVTKTFDSFSYEAGQKLANALSQSFEGMAGKTIDDLIDENIVKVDAKGNLSIEYDILGEYLDQISKNLDETNLKLYNNLRAEVDQHQRELSDTSVMSTIIQNRDKLSEENIQSLANMLNMTYDNVLNGLHKNADGTYTISLADIVSLIQSGKMEVSQTVYDLLAEQIDNTIVSINKIVSSQSKGFTEIGEMQNYVKQLREAGIKNAETNESFTLSELFDFNDALHAYQLSEIGIIANIKGMKGQLEELKKRAYKDDGRTIIDQNAVDQYNAAMKLVNDAPRQFAEAIDISGFLSISIGDPSKAIKTNELRKAIENYNTALVAIGETEGLNTNNIILALNMGGEDAVHAAETIAEAKGTTLSAEDVEAAYRGQVNNFTNAIDTIVAKPGEIVDTITASIINQNGGQVSQLGTTGQYVVESAANLYEAYNHLLRQMAATGEATLADLNNVAAKALENRDGEQQIIDTLGDASNMTYTRFGEILAQQGIELTEQLVDSMANAGIIKQLGGANMAITDFKGLADIFGWDANSEQFVSAFKTYNDSIIQMNRQVERNILEEAQSVASAQGGDWINLTQLTSKMQETYEKAIQSPTAQSSGIINPLTALNEKLKEYGAYIEDGILKIGETADIPAIMQAVAQAAAESGGLLSNEMAQLADTVADAIKSYADLISGGIEGSLTNIQAEQLQDWANKNGVGQLDFTPTEKGLKVATAQAQKLVAALKKVDSIQGKLTFDKMVESLSTDKGGKFSNISKTTAEIAKLQRQIAKNEDSIKQLDKIKGMTRDSEQTKKSIQNLEQENSKLREQISLYREIQEAQSIDPSQYNFMDRDLPEVMQGPINYWNSVGKAFTAMNEASQTGKMAIQDFYNIVNEMNNLMAISGEQIELAGVKLDGSAEAAAALIQKGMSSLTNIDGKGVKVNLEGLGIDFAAGADSAKSNFADGVHALAESQIAMLDAAIKVLEVIVAMEQLKDVDVNGDNKLNIGEIFDLSTPETGDFTDNFKKGAQAILDMADEVGNEDLKEALNDISVNGNTLREMLEVAAKGLSETGKSWEDLGLTEQQYASIIDSFYQALMNGDYNLDSIQSSVWEILDKTLPDGTVIEVGDRTITIAGGTHTVINWEDENTKEALKYFGEDIEKSKKEVEASIQRYQSGKGNTIDALVTLAVNGKIQITVDEKGNIDITGPNGKKIDPKSDTGKKLISQAAMENAGIKDGDVITDPMGHFIRSEGTVKVGDTTINVTSDGEGNVKYHSDTLGQDFSSLDSLLHAEYGKYVEQQAGPGGSGEVMSFDTWLQANYNVHTVTSAVFKNKNGEVIDPSTMNDPEFEKSVNDFISQSHDSIQDYLNDKSNWSQDGDYWTLELPDGGSITVEAPDWSSAADKAEDAALRAADPIAASVKTGIEKAFQGEGKDSVQSAITGAIQSALGLGGGEGGAGNEIPIPQIVLQPSSITIDIAQAGQPTLSNTNGTRDLQIDEVILKPNDVKLDLTGYTPTTEGENVSNENVPIGGVTLQPNKITIDTSSVKPEAIESLEADVSAVNATPSAAPTITNTAELTSTIETLEATVTTLKASASNVDASEASSSIISKIQEALNNNEFKITVGINLSGGESDSDKPTSSSSTPTTPTTPSVGDGGLGGLAAAINALSSAASSAAGQLGVVSAALLLAKSDELVAASIATTTAKSTDLVNASKATTDANSAEISTASKAISDTQATKVVTATGAINNIDTTPATNARTEINGISSIGAGKAKEAINNIDSGPAAAAKSALNNISVDLPGSKDTDITLRYKVSKTSAKGNVGNFAKAKGSGPAKVGGSTKTLMGELGPELVVSNGRYFIAGANGAEFVDLANDAIVFNHLQTRRLMSQGAIGGRGRPTTNEREAVAFAKGKVPSFGPARETGEDQDSKQQAQEKRESEKITSVSVSPSSHTFHNLVRFQSRAKGTGPAMASASEALALLKQLRAMWQSLAEASLADMGGNAGRGGGGGGGGGDDGSEEKNQYYAGISESIERWYNWLKLIEKTQEKINKLTKEYTILENDSLATEKRLANLKEQYESREKNKENRQKLVEEQTKARTDLINAANKGLFSAFWQADSDTGTIELAGDQAFKDYLKKSKQQGTLGKKIYQNQGTANLKINRKYTETELSATARENFEKIKNNKNKYSDTLNANKYNKLNKYEKAMYKVETNKKGNKVYKLRNDAEDKYINTYINQNKNKNKSMTITRNIKTGLDFMAELQAKDEAGNLIHNAADQLSLIKSMGLWTEDLELGIDKDTEGWEQSVVQRFYDKIENDKSEIEALNKSIQEQEQAALEDAIAIQEINDKIRELVQPVTGVTEGLTKWYNETQKIKTAQAEINKLNKELSNFQNDFIANGFKIFKNYKDQEDSLNRQNKINEELLKKRQDLAGTLTSKYSGLIKKGIISVDENGTATFSDSKVNNGKIQTSYQQIATNDQGYQIYEIKDEKGEVTQEYYVDNKGVVRNNKNNEKIEDENIIHSGILKYNNFSGKSYDTTGKTFEQIIEDITSQDAFGKVAYNAEEQYQILKSLGLEDFMKYDEKGNQIYKDFGELSKEDMQKAVEAGIKRIQGSVEEINENNDERINLEQEQLEIQSQLQSIQKALIDNQIEVENLVKDAVVQEHQDAIDAKKSFAEAISDAASKTIEGMRKSLDNEKKRNESDKNNKELTLLQMQLTTAQMSGSSVSRIRDLQKQIQDKQQEMYYNEREALINELEEQTNETVEALNDQTEIAQTALDYQVKYGEIWEEVNEKIKILSEEGLADYVLKNTPDYLSSSELARQETETKILEQIQTLAAENKYQQLENESNALLSKQTDSRFKNNDVKEAVLKAGQEAFKNTDGTLEQKNEAAKKAMSSKINEYQNTFNNQDAASRVTSQINSLGNITSLNQESSVQSARKAYDSLGNAKSYVSQDTLNKLIAAEKKINELKQPKEEPKKEPKKDENPPSSTGESGTSGEPQDPGDKKLIAEGGATPPPPGTYAFTDDWENNKKTKNIVKAIKKISPTYGLKAFAEKIDELYNANKGDEAKTYEAINKLNNETDLKKIVKKYRNKHNKWPIYTTSKKIKYYATAKNALNNTNPSGTIKAGTKIPFVAISKSKRTTDKAQILKGRDGKFYPYLKTTGKLSKQIEIPQFAKGGDIDFTGIAQVDGSKSEPEHIFNFKQMEALRAHLLSGVDTTSRAVAGLSNIIENLPNVNTYNNINNDNSGININNLEFHMEVKEISNDYDARRAGQQAMEEMVRIAYKAGNRSISRR